MTGRLFFDTNILIYALDPKDPAKRSMSMEAIAKALTQGRLVVSPQILNECVWVAAYRKKLVSPADIERYLSAFHHACTAPLDVETHRLAIRLSAKHRLSWWDSIALASALQARCEAYVSEDMADGQAVESLTIINPFGPRARATLALT